MQRRLATINFAKCEGVWSAWKSQDGHAFTCNFGVLCYSERGTQWKSTAQYQVSGWKGIGFWTFYDDMTAWPKAVVSQTWHMPVAPEHKMLWTCNLHQIKAEGLEIVSHPFVGMITTSVLELWSLEDGQYSIMRMTLLTFCCHNSNGTSYKFAVAFSIKSSSWRFCKYWVTTPSSD